MLVGEPGTAKSWLSELICAAISNDSTLVVQGGAIETVQQLLYSWNKAIVERKGPCLEALIPGRCTAAWRPASWCAAWEIARSSPALQDALSIMSGAQHSIPELRGGGVHPLRPRGLQPGGDLQYLGPGRQRDERCAETADEL